MLIHVLTDRALRLRNLCMVALSHYFGVRVPMASELAAYDRSIGLRAAWSAWVASVEGAGTTDLRRPSLRSRVSWWRRALFGFISLVSHFRRYLTFLFRSRG